ncbi:MAG: FAD binding domain-containing protein [Candidatus Ornithospirochaeta sp.]|nr:FAD binding domain-containing protein [Candidatus Ornithospirochaeta sp.]
MAEVMAFVPETLSEALAIRKEYHARPLAGGTDLMVQHFMGHDVDPEFGFPVMIISGIEELKGIISTDSGVVIKALTTSAEIAADERVPYPVRKAASLMGAISLRNSATIGGNIGNASPKGDLPQPLILLDASVNLISQRGRRSMKLDQFIVGAKKTKLEDDEIIESVFIPRADFDYIYYRKIGTRRANAISKLSLSAAARIEDGVVADFRASSGAAGPKVIRSYEAENILKGKRVEELEALMPEFLDSWNNAISPHAMPKYRRNTTRRMLAYFIETISKCPEKGIIE